MPALTQRRCLSSVVLLAVAALLTAGCVTKTSTAPAPPAPQTVELPPDLATEASTPVEWTTSIDTLPSDLALDTGILESPDDEALLDNLVLKAKLDNREQAELQQVKYRISYPEELMGGALIKSATEAGKIRFYYPLRSAGGVSFDPNTRAVKINPPDEASVNPLMDALRNYLDKDNEKVSWYKPLNMLEIDALEENLPSILDVLSFLDAPAKQIIIEASVWEITDVLDTQLGSRVNVAKKEGGSTFFSMFDSRFDVQGFLDTLTSGQPYQGSTLDFVTAADANNAKIQLVFQFLKNRGYADLVSQPRMRVTLGTTAKIMTGEQVPYQMLKGVSTRLEVTTQFKDVGVQLYVTPTIARADAITIGIVPIVSEVIGYTDPGPNGVSNPIIANREAGTVVTVANRELITIGGLNQTKKTVTESKVPILGDIPLLGYLFKSKRETTKKVQLWFTVQPTIAGASERLVIPELTGTGAMKAPE